jgi:hypothetical protein
MTRAQRGPGVALGAIATIIGLSGVNDWVQVVASLATGGGEPPVLIALHVVSGSLAVAAAAATWRRAAHAPALVLAWGVAITVLLVAVPWAVGLEGDAARGIYISAAGVLAAGAAMAWWVRRRLRHDAR